MHLNRSLILAGLLATTTLPAHAEEWKTLASDQGVKLEAQAIGNVGRLRFTNTNKSKTSVQWKAETALASKKKIENQGDLNLDAGETVVVSNGPFRDASGPLVIQAIQGKFTVSPAAK